MLCSRRNAWREKKNLFCTTCDVRALLLTPLSAMVAAMASAIMEVLMGDKSPKSKQKDDKQKQAKGKVDAAKAQAKQQPKAAAPKK